jgi:hypothetical protein
MWRERYPCTLLVGMQASATTLKKIWSLLKNLNIDLLYDPGIPLLGIYLKECHTGYSRAPAHPCLLQCYLHSQVMETTKMLQYWWVDQENVAFIHNGSSLSHEEEWNLSFTSKWMELENIILSEVSQAQKTKNRMFTLMCGLRSRANTAMWLDLSHTTRGEHIQEIRE